MVEPWILLRDYGSTPYPSFVKKIPIFKYGGCSSEVECLIVAQKVEMAEFSFHPNKK